MLKLSVACALCLIALLACLGVAAEATIPAESAPSIPLPSACGGWLRINERMHLDPERKLAVVFGGEKNRVTRACLVDLVEKKAAKLCDIPAELVVHTPSYDRLPQYAALSADRKILYFDMETEEDAAVLPNGRTCLRNDVATGRQEVVALRRTIFALPIGGDKAFALTQNGDFNEWSYDTGSDRIIAVACENGQTGLVVLKPDGKREFMCGYRPNKAGSAATFGGVPLPHGGNAEHSPCILGDHLFTISGSSVRKYARGSTNMEQLSPFSPAKSLDCLVALTSRRELLVGVREANEVQLYIWALDKAAAPKPIGQPFHCNAAPGHDLCVTSDQAAVWYACGSITRGYVDPKVSVVRLDLKTGQSQIVWTSAEILELVAKSEKEPSKK